MGILSNVIQRYLIQPSQYVIFSTLFLHLKYSSHQKVKRITHSSASRRLWAGKRTCGLRSTAVHGQRSHSQNNQSLSGTDQLGLEMHRQMCTMPGRTSQITFSKPCRLSVSRFYHLPHSIPLNIIELQNIANYNNLSKHQSTNIQSNIAQQHSNISKLH